MSTWILLVIMLNPGDAHGTSLRVSQPSAGACQAAKELALASNAKVRAAGIRQQMVATCVERKL